MKSGKTTVAQSVILACEMIEDEVRLALEALPPDERPELVWVESGLHERPERLREALQSLLDRLDHGAETGESVTLPSVKPGRGPADKRRQEIGIGPKDEVVLALGFCGSALQGLSARHLNIVFPRVDDCIALLLNRGCTREEIPRDPRHYYLTRGWFNHESTLQEMFDDWETRYGAERAARLRKAMFAGYEQVSLIDTRAYDLRECSEDSRRVAEGLELEHGVVEGSVQLLERLFKGERGGEIVLVPPGTTIELTHLVSPKEECGDSAVDSGFVSDGLGESIQNRESMSGTKEDPAPDVGPIHCASSAKQKGAKGCTS